jgi:hypothetical protein
MGLIEKKRHEIIYSGNDPKAERVGGAPKKQEADRSLIRGRRPGSAGNTKDCASPI